MRKKIISLFITSLSAIFATSNHLSAARLVCRNVFTICNTIEKKDGIAKIGDYCRIPGQQTQTVTGLCTPSEIPHDSEGWSYFKNDDGSYVYKQSKGAYLITQDNHEAKDLPAPSSFDQNLKNITEINNSQCRSESCEPNGYFIACVTGVYKINLMNLIPQARGNATGN